MYTQITFQIMTICGIYLITVARQKNSWNRDLLANQLCGFSVCRLAKNSRRISLHYYIGTYIIIGYHGEKKNLHNHSEVSLYLCSVYIMYRIVTLCTVIVYTGQQFQEYNMFQALGERKDWVRNLLNILMYNKMS
jgi:uncharacterized membrane protein YuzA (DUF378 family)